MEMEDQYGMADLRQYINERTHFTGIPPPADLFSGNLNLTPAQHYDMVMVPHGLPHQDFPRADSTTSASVTGTSPPTASLSGLEMEAGGVGGDGGTGRWPRQETLTLLEIRSKLDSKFKEANQKGPLWDEVSRILSEEHGYQRTGKKCREKFENLYKYYKKTKEGKAGRQDGKHYRFFRQLEALYGETSNPNSVSETHLIGSSFRFTSGSGPINNTATQPNQEACQAPKFSDSLSLSNSSAFDTSSSDDSDLNATKGMENDSMEKTKKRRGKISWKAKIKEFVDLQMKRLMERQEAWLEKMMKTIEHKEQERMIREEEWRKQEAARIDREQKFWANERAWIESRDAALMEAFQKLTGKDFKASSDPKEIIVAGVRNLGENQNHNESETNSWPECEIARLIQLRTGMEPRFQQGGSSEEVLWEEIAAKMGCFGYERSALMCKSKWDWITNYVMKFKKRKENSRGGCGYYQNNESLCSQGGGAYCENNNIEQGPEAAGLAPSDHHGASPPNNSNTMNDSCFRFLVGDSGNLWDNYGMKLSKGENH